MENIILKQLRNIGNFNWKFNFDLKRGCYSGCEKSAKISEIVKTKKYPDGVVYYDKDDNIVMFSGNAKNRKVS